MPPIRWPRPGRSSRVPTPGTPASAESATGYFWGDPALRAEMNQLVDEAMDRGDDRMDQLARRFLRAAGTPRED